MYSLSNFLRQTPTAISTGVGTVLTNIALAGWSPFTDKQNLCIVAIVFVLLNLLYISPLVSSNAKLLTLQSALDEPPPVPLPPAPAPVDVHEPVDAVVKPTRPDPGVKEERAKPASKPLSKRVTKKATRKKPAPAKRAPKRR